MHKIRLGEEPSKTAIERQRFQMVLMGSSAGIAPVLRIGRASLACCRTRWRGGVRERSGCRSHRRRTQGSTQAGIRDAMQLVAAGLILGLACAVAGGRVLDSMVYGVRLGDPILLASACCMIGTGLAAAYMPNERHPRSVQALRSD
jgi:hypothetical protein